jgi:hypothetical protein
MGENSVDCHCGMRQTCRNRTAVAVGARSKDVSESSACHRLEERRDHGRSHEFVLGESPDYLCRMKLHDLSKKRPFHEKIQVFL